MIKIPNEVKIVSWVTALYRLGYGFVEPLIPVFLYNFSGSFSQAGFLLSFHYIFFILITPVVGIIGDKVSTKKMLLMGLLFYPFISISYFLSGVFAMSIFIIIARTLNGLATSFISIGRQNCIYKYTSNKNISQALGYFESVTNFARMIPMFLGLFLIGFFPIHYLFLFILFFSIIALLLGYYKLPNENGQSIRKSINFSNIKNNYCSIYKDFLKYDNKLKNVLIIGLLVSIIKTAFLFFIPIDAYNSGASYKMIIIIAMIGAISELMGVIIGKLSDKFPLRSFFLGFIFLILILLISIVSDDYYFKLVIVLFFGIFAKFIEYTKNKFFHNLILNNEKLGSLNGLNEQLLKLGSMLGPLIIGLVIQIGGIKSGIIFLLFNSLLALVMGIKTIGKYNLNKKTIENEI